MEGYGRDAANYLIGRLLMLIKLGGTEGLGLSTWINWLVRAILMDHVHS